MAESTLPAQFWARVRKSDGCWEWTGSTNGRGYGQVYQGWDSGRRRSIYSYAHRLAFADVNGSIPEGLEVCHRCDNPPCVRPDHLFVGTHAENHADASRKGRSRGGSSPGEKNPAARLTAVDVDVIRHRYRMGETQLELANAYGVARTTIGMAVTGRTWKEAQ